jgi:hypothetical protein
LFRQTGSEITPTEVDYEKRKCNPAPKTFKQISAKKKNPETDSVSKSGRNCTALSPAKAAQTLLYDDETECFDSSHSAYCKTLYYQERSKASSANPSVEEAETAVSEIDT